MDFKKLKQNIIDGKHSGNVREKERYTHRNIMKFKNMKVRENSESLQRKNNKTQINNIFFNNNTGYKRQDWNLEASI